MKKGKEALLPNSYSTQLFNSYSFRTKKDEYIEKWIVDFRRLAFFITSKIEYGIFGKGSQISIFKICDLPR